MQRQMNIPQLSVINKFLLIAIAVVFIIGSIVGPNFVAYLGLSLQGIKTGLIYQFLTYAFVEQSLMSVVFDGLLIWFIGSELEAKWGPKLYVQFFIASVLGAAGFYCLLSLFMAPAVMFGMNGFTFALLMAYGVIYSERQLTFMLIFPMKAMYFCMLLAGIQLYMGFFSGQGAISFSHLFSMVIGFGFLRYKSFLAKGGLDKMRREQQKSKMRSKLKIVTDEEETKANQQDPKYWQ